MTQRSILVVDDDVALCELVRVFFELEGFDVMEANDAAEADRLLVYRVPDAIVLDVGLPGIDGLSYCRALREDPRTTEIPIVLLSGYHDAGELAATAGATRFVRKPFDPFDLLVLVESTLRVG